MTAQTYLDSLKSKIASGTRGAPARRALYERMVHAHNVHRNRLLPSFSVNCPSNYRLNILRSRHSLSCDTAIVTREAERQEYQRIRAISARYTPQRTREQEIYCSAWVRALAQNRVCPDGSIVEYMEDTEWEKYGRKSYPRTTNRRLERITPTGHTLIRRLEPGEVAETAITAIVPGRAEKIKIRKQLESLKK